MYGVPMQGLRDLSGTRSEYASLSEYAYRTLRDNIVNGKLQPRTRLPEIEVAKALGVSRVPIRDALGRLVEDQLVEKRPDRKGAVVATPTPETMLEFYEVRAVLEVLSVRLTAQHRTQGALDRLWDLVGRGTSAAQRGEWETSSRLGSEFHRIIVEASTNTHLSGLIRQYDQKIGWAHAAIAQKGGAIRWAEHLRVVEAIQEQDQSSAVQAMTAHTDAYTHCFADYASDPDGRRPTNTPQGHQ